MKRIVMAASLFLACMPLSSAWAGKMFNLDPKKDATSNISWPFSNYNNYNWALNGYGHEARGSAHFGSDKYAEDWNHGDNSDDCNEKFKSPLSGYVMFAGIGDEDNYGNPYYGKQVVVLSDFDPNFAFRIGHLNSISVNVNDRVEIGTELGEIGNSGTDDCHAHVVLYKNIRLNYDPSSDDNSPKNKGPKPAVYWLSLGSDLGLLGSQRISSEKFAAKFKFNQDTDIPKDISQDYWAASYIYKGLEENILPFLFNSENFEAGKIVLRYELARVIAVNRYKLGYTSFFDDLMAQEVFDDVPEHHDYFVYIQALKNKKIYSGRDRNGKISNNFRPDDPVTFGELAEFIANTFELPDPGIPDPITRYSDLLDYEIPQLLPFIKRVTGNYVDRHCMSDSKRHLTVSSKLNPNVHLVPWEYICTGLQAKPGGEYNPAGHAPRAHVAKYIFNSYQHYWVKKNPPVCP